MHFASQDPRGWWFAGLLAVFVSSLASQAFGQTATRTAGVAPPNHLRSAAVRGRSPGFTPPQMRMASAARAVTEDDIVAGGTYMQDPDTGQLYATDKMILPSDPKVMPTEKVVLTEGAIAEPWVTDAGCGDACLAPCDVVPVGNLELFAGVQGFTGPRNQGGSGSFGFHQGLNYAIPIPGFLCLGGQIGFRATQSSLSGAEFTDNSRNQGFLTAGLFRRVDVGLQGGVVLDYLTESWYDANIDMTNVRGEISWVVGGTHDFGFWFSTGTRSSNAGDDDEVERWVATDLYAFFYRLQFGGCRDGDARLFAGWTGNSDGLIGVDIRLPLAPDWALESNFTYLIPNEGAGEGFEAGHTQESWNIGMSLVWYPGRLWGAGDYYYRPLFRVADNGNFLID